MTASSKKKSTLINQTVQALPLKKKSKSSSNLEKQFVRYFYEQVPQDDLAECKPPLLSDMAHSIFELGRARKPGGINMRVFCPQKKKDGWHVPHTVIEIVNDDMPFLIDSVAAELNRQGLVIETIIHPMLRVKRDSKGEMKNVYSLSAAPKTAVKESYIHIQVEKILPAAVANKLKRQLTQIVEDVTAATSDWKYMLQCLDDSISDMCHLPGHIAAKDADEARDFLRYVYDNNFTLLGYREYKISGSGKTLKASIVKGSGLGVLQDNNRKLFTSGGRSAEVEALLNAKGPLIVNKLIDNHATVHRRVPMDIISVKQFDAKGRVSGQRVFVGLFTSTTYSCRTADVPLIRQKIATVMEKTGFEPGTHDRKALEHILEKYPRDELFQMSSKKILTTCLGILRLQERQRVALFTRKDAFNRYISCLVYVPREDYDTRFRMKIEEVLERYMKGRCVNFYTTLDDSPLARVLITVLVDPKKPPKFDKQKMEGELIELGRAWPDRLKQGLVKAHGKKQGTELSHYYSKAFSNAYQEEVRINGAVHDIRHIEHILGNGEIAVDLYKLLDAPDHELRLKVYHEGAPVPLSTIVPMFENMGLRTIAEHPYEITPAHSERPIWIHDFIVHMDMADKIDLKLIKEKFEQTLLKTWYHEVDNDFLNCLVLKGGLAWEEVLVMRAYLGYLRQLRFPYSRTYISQTLSTYPAITGMIVDLFKILHDPAHKNRDKDSAKLLRKLDAKLEAVALLDHDRILRAFKTLVQNTLRTNFYQRTDQKTRKPWLSMKINSKNIPFVPLPRPHVEIYVYSSRMEGVHLRGGEIARGGLRWSDRHEDYRTEILGLVKSQIVKNAVIVPVGAKGGFIVKNPPTEGGRDAFLAEGIECYKILINGLLDITDNNVKGRIKKPANTVCHDGNDPYLVVAADKGTATFSDIANGISNERGFWLGDAFASGGSAGYDHKAMGITARGAWEAVKRHFREMDKNIQKEPFTVVGVGDMGGDVFGNGMLLSEQIKLIGAFNHLHIFCDPSPNPAKSFKERQRLFKARGGWDQYNKKLLSSGGRIYERSAKSIKLTPKIKECFGIEANEVTPNELIRAMLQSEIELLWFGGIGTYIKSARESHADADDKTNDGLRVNADDLRAKVIGEGANLGVTQRGRTDFSQHGGRVNTDFIDNSAGVDTSDHEVNIKILLSDVMTSEKLSMAERDKLLKKMEKDVALHVLSNNYQQTQALTLNEYMGVERAGLQARFIRDLEKQGRIDRQLEGLPDDEALDRIIRERGRLNRPEYSVLLAYSKITFLEDLLKTDIPDDEQSASWLFGYFPQALHKYKKQILRHRLKREIIATNMVNTLVNRMGPVFVKSRMDKTGACVDDVARAFIIMVEAFGVKDLWDKIESLDNKVPADVQTYALYEVQSLIKRAVTWLLRHGDEDLDLAVQIKMFKPGIEAVKKCIDDVVTPEARKNIKAKTKELTEKGLPEKLAHEIATFPVLISACDIVRIGQQCGSKVKSIAYTYFRTGARLKFDWLRECLYAITAETLWEARAVGTLVDDFFTYQADLSSRIIQELGCPIGKQDLFELWEETHQEAIFQIDQLLTEMAKSPVIDLSMLTIAEQRLRYLTYAD